MFSQTSPSTTEEDEIREISTNGTRQAILRVVTYAGGVGKSVQSSVMGNGEPGVMSNISMCRGETSDPRGSVNKVVG